MKKILFVVNDIDFFISHRVPIAFAAQAEGYEVHLACPSGKKVPDVISFGFNYHEVPLTRNGQNPLKELYAVLTLYRLYKQINPDLIHLVTIKPVLYGGIAARLTNVKAVVAAVSGLGTAFIAQSVAARIRKLVVSFLYQVAFSHKNLTVIFQNPDDRDTLINLGVISRKQVKIIRGSGVSTDQYVYTPEPTGKPVVAMAARLLKDKGVFEFIEASRILKKRGVDVTMRLIGSPDPGNLTSVTEAELNAWCNEGAIESLGYREDIAFQYAAANIVCLPSYREGLPKGLVEAAACGRAVVTTDVPGCRDAIEPGVTGLLVPVKDAEALADAIQTLIDSPERRLQMGLAGRKLAEDSFAIEKIVGQHMSIYRELTSTL